MKDRDARWLAKTFNPVRMFHKCVFGIHRARCFESCSVKFEIIFARGRRDNKQPPFQQPKKGRGRHCTLRSSSKLVQWLPTEDTVSDSATYEMHVNTVFQHESWTKLTRNKNESDVFRNEVMAYFYFLTPGKWLTLEQTVTCLDWFSVSTATWFYVIERVMRLTK